MEARKPEKNSPSAGDQRLHRRVGYADPVRLYVARSVKPLDCPAVNISRGGLSVSSTRPLLVGRELSLEVETGQGAVRVESAEVVWTRPLGAADKPSDGAYAWEMGLQFVCLSLKNRNRMESLIDQLTGSRRDEGRATQPGRGGGTRCGPTFDLESRLLPDFQAQAPRRGVEVVMRSDRLKEFRGRLLAMAAVILATAALLSFLVIGMTTPGDRAAKQQFDRLQSRLREAERQVARLENRIDRIMTPPKNRKSRPPAALGPAASAGITAVKSVPGGRYFRPVAIALK